MFEGYNFPGKFPKPFDHQVEMFKFHLSNPHSFNLSTMGTGKTMGALWTADFLIRKGAIKKVLIVAPLSILDSVWKMHIFENFLDMRCAVVHGTKKQRLDALAKDVNYYIINHDGPKTITDALVKAQFDLVIVDELTAFKDAQTDRSKAMKKVCKSAKGVIGMTGSPVSDRPTDAYGQAKLVHPDNPLLPEYFGIFRDRVVQKFDDFTWLPKPGWQHEVDKILSPAIRFELRECIDLPPTLYEERKVKMSKDQEAAYKDMINENETMFNGGLITAVNAGVRYIKLLQIACGIAIDEDETVHDLNAKPKYDEIIKIWKEYGRGPTIVCSSFIASLKLIRDNIKKREPHSTVELVYGDVSRKERARIFSEFDKGLIDFLVIQPKVAAHGLDLTTSNLLIWFCPHPSNEVTEQTNARIARPGQKRAQIIVKLSNSDADTKVYRALDNKDRLSSLYISLLKKPKFY